MPDTFGARVAAARRRKKWTQQDLAFALAAKGHRVNTGDISRLERGDTRTPSLDRIVALAAVLDETTDHLLGHRPPKAVIEAFLAARSIAGPPGEEPPPRPGAEGPPKSNQANGSPSPG